MASAVELGLELLELLGQARPFFEARARGRFIGVGRPVPVASIVQRGFQIFF